MSKYTDAAIPGLVGGSLFIDGLVNGTLNFSSQENRVKLFTLLIMVISELPTPIKPLWDIFDGISLMIDLYDAYGFNNAVTRGMYDPTIKGYYRNLLNFSTTISNGLRSKEGIPEFGFTPEKIQQLKDAGIFDQTVKLLTRFGLVMEGPIYHDQELLNCTFVTARNIDIKCKIPSYKERWMQIYTENEPAFRADAKAKRDEAIKKAAEKYLSVDPDRDVLQVDRRKKISYLLIALVGGIAIITYSISKNIWKK